MKTAVWDATRARIKPLFEAAGIIRCELAFTGCTGRMFLGFAHALKRRNIPRGQEDVVILACTSCHHAIETQPEATMERIVHQTIARRRTQPGATSCYREACAATQAEERLANLMEATFKPGSRPLQDWTLLRGTLANLRHQVRDHNALTLLEEQP